MPDRFTFHVTSLPHTRVSTEFSACAYTAKIRLFAKMMKSLGHEVILYAPEGSTADCDELVQTLSTKEQAGFFGEYDWQREGFKIDWSSDQPYWKLANRRTAGGIAERAKKGDIVCVVGGWCQEPLTRVLNPDVVAITEPFVGYRGVYARFQVCESYTHQAKLASVESLNGSRKTDDANGDNYHDVIPVYFDPDEFPEGIGQGGYYAYLGRLIQRKGIAIAENTVRAMGNGAVLKIAGQGVKSWDAETRRLETEDGQVFQGPHIDYVGFVNVEQRAKFLGDAIAAFCPTQYFEPGGNASVEPQACGTPVLASNFGCFTQQVLNGVSGFRPTTLEEWILCAEACKTLDRSQVRAHAHGRFSIGVVKYLFQEYFQRIYNLYMREGWTAKTPEWAAFPYFM